MLAPESSASRSLHYQAVLEFVGTSDDILTALRNQLARDGLTVEGFQALAALRNKPVPATPTLLAEQIGTTRALLSHTLNRLEFSGLIDRQRSGGDRRVIWVKLTELGGTTIEKTAATWNESIAQLVRLFDEPALMDLIKFCAKLRKGAAKLI